MIRPPPWKDETRGLGGAAGSEGSRKADAPDCATAAGPLAHRLSYRAALLGIELQPDAAGWRLMYAAFGTAGHLGTVPSLPDVEAALDAFAIARAEVLALAERAGCVR